MPNLSLTSSSSAYDAPPIVDHRDDEPEGCALRNEKANDCEQPCATHEHAVALPAAKSYLFVKPDYGMSPTEQASIIGNALACKKKIAADKRADDKALTKAHALVIAQALAANNKMESTAADAKATAGADKRADDTALTKAHALAIAQALAATNKMESTAADAKATAKAIAKTCVGKAKGASAPTTSDKQSIKVAVAKNATKRPPEPDHVSGTTMYNGGKIHCSLAKKAWRVFTTATNRVDEAVKWQDDSTGAWTKALDKIDAARAKAAQ